MKGPWLTSKENAEMKSLFRQFDKNSSGLLDIEELTAVLQSSGHTYTLDQIQEVVDSITGVPESKGLSFDQFSNMLRINLPPPDHLARSRSRFDLFDLDHSGEVSFPEFTECITGLDELITSSEIELMFSRTDKDNSGSVSFHEFLAMMEQGANITNRAAISEEAEKRDGQLLNETPAFHMPDWTPKLPVTVEVSTVEVPSST